MIDTINNNDINVESVMIVTDIDEWIAIENAIIEIVTGSEITIANGSDEIVTGKDRKGRNVENAGIGTEIVVIGKGGVVEMNHPRPLVGVGENEAGIVVHGGNAKRMTIHTQRHPAANTTASLRNVTNEVRTRTTVKTPTQPPLAVELKMSSLQRLSEKLNKKTLENVRC